MMLYNNWTDVSFSAPCFSRYILQEFTCLLAVLFTLSGCTLQEGQKIDITGQDIRLTLLHTSDWHGRLLPYDMDVLLTDEQLGLDPTLGPYGGVARLAYLIERERANAGRSLYVDSGDCFQGAPIFNTYHGEATLRAMSMLRPDGVVIGNHEFDEGLTNFVTQAANWSEFPFLAANYHYLAPLEPGVLSLGDIAQPFTIVNVDGLKVGIIGLANFSSLSSIGFADNSLEIQPIDLVQSVQTYINLLHPNVNLIIGVSHAGLSEDIEIIEQTVGLDIIMGGHLHIVLDPPRLIEDASGRQVLLAHSGAFLKYLGRLDVVLRGLEENPDDFEVESHIYETFPLDNLVPESTDMLRLLEPYVDGLRQEIDIAQVIAYSPRRIRRFGITGGDSPLGNFVTDSIRNRQRVETDFAINNSLGIRSDIVQGPVIIDQTYNIFPFPNTITTMTLSGNEIQEMLNYNAERSASRGCATQLQVSGITMINDCSVSPAVARDVRIIRGSDTAGNPISEPIEPNLFYTMATNNYIAGGGSGFQVLRFNNTQQDTGISIRDAVNDAMRAESSCLHLCEEDGETRDSCPLLYSCRDDLYAYYLRFCEGLEQFSPQAMCLDQLAPTCLNESPVSDFDICLQFSTTACNERYHLADQLSCADESQDACVGETQISPQAACIESQNANICLSESLDSSYSVCADQALANAELTCLDIPCIDAYADDRIIRILPTNDYVETDDFDVLGQDAAALMIEIESSEENIGACF
jgi:5'-nucleotidase